MLITEMIIGHVQRINDAFGRNELGNEQKLDPMSTEASMSYATVVVTVVAVTFGLSSTMVNLLP